MKKNSLCLNGIAVHVLPPTDTRCVLYEKPLIFLRNTTLRRENSASRGCSINIKNTRVFPKNNRIYPLFFSPRHESAAIRPLRHGRRVHWSQRRRSPYPPPPLRLPAIGPTAAADLAASASRTQAPPPHRHRHHGNLYPTPHGVGGSSVVSARRS